MQPKSRAMCYEALLASGACVVWRYDYCTRIVYSELILRYCLEHSFSHVKRGVLYCPTTANDVSSASRLLPNYAALNFRETHPWE